MGHPLRHSRQAVIALLPATELELRTKLSTSPSVIHRYMKQAEDLGEAHVGEWWIHPTNQRRVKVWYAGPGRTPEQPPTSKAEHRRRKLTYKRKATGMQFDIHPLQAAFFGTQA